MFIEIILLIIGLAILSISADMLIDAVVRLAKKLNISKLVISLTLVALGTSIPETVVSIMSAVKGSSIAFSNVVGSNIANIALIVGVSLLIGNIILDKKMKMEINKMIFITGLFIVLCIAGFTLNKISGMIMIFCLGIYVFSLYKSSKEDENIEEEVEEEEETISKIGMLIFKKEWLLILGFVIFGFAGLIGGGELVVNNAINIARHFNINEGIIGATIAAVGTSLPELVTSTAAVRKKHYDILIGNVVGSNIINILLILGVSSVLVNIQITSFELISIAILTIITVTFYIFSRTSQKLNKMHGVILLLMYIASSIIFINIG